jgi:hypothetical protein
MKKSIILTIIISIIITLVIGIILTNKPKKDYSSISDYDHKCSYETTMDDESTTTKKVVKNLYLKLDEDDYVINATYESIYENDYFSSTLKALTQDLLDIYNEIDGVEASINTNKNKSYVVIKYDYNKINFKELKSVLKDVLDKDSLQYKMNKKIKVEEYINNSSEYSCIKK